MSDQSGKEIQAHWAGDDPWPYDVVTVTATSATTVPLAERQAVLERITNRQRQIEQADAWLALLRWVGSRSGGWPS